MWPICKEETKHKISSDAWKKKDKRGRQTEYKCWAKTENMPKQKLKDTRQQAGINSAHTAGSARNSGKKKNKCLILAGRYHFIVKNQAPWQQRTES